MQTVRTKHDAVALLDGYVLDVHANHGFLSDTAGEDETIVAALGLILADEAELALHGDVRVVGRDLPDLSFAREINPGIADIADGDAIVAEDGDGQRGGHAFGGLVFHALVENGKVGRVEHLCQQLLRRQVFLRFAEYFQRHLHRQPAGDIATPLAADAIGQDRDGPAAALFLGRLRLPEANVILVP